MLKDFIPGTIRVLSNITPILIFFIFAQSLDINNLGLINYFISLITIIGVFTDFGIPEATQRFLPQERIKANLVTYTIKLETFIVVAGAFAILLSDILLKTNIANNYLAFLFFIIIFSASNTIILIFNGLNKSKHLSKFFGLSSVTFFITTLGLYFLLGINPVTAFLLGRLISWIIFTAIPLYYLSKSKLFTISKNINKEKKKRFNNFAINSFIYVSSLTLLFQWDSIIITNIDGAYVNGIYKSVVFIATIPIILVTIIHTKLLPFLSSLYSKKDYSEMVYTIQIYTNRLLTLIIAGFILQLFIYKPILNILLDKEIVLHASYLFPIAFLAVCIYILITPQISILQAIGEEKIIRNLALAQTIIFIFLSTFLYYTYGFIIFPILLVILNFAFLLIIKTYTKSKINTLLNTNGH